MAELRQAAPDVPRSILFGPGLATGGHDRRLPRAGRHATPTRASDRSSRRSIDAFHAAGLLVMTPHTNDAAEARYFAEIGVDVIASDDPRIVSRCVGQRR